MDWWREKKKKKKQRLERGAMLLEDLIECCDGKSNPIKFFSAHQIRKATKNFSKSNQLYDYDYKWFSGKDESHPMVVLIKKGRFREETFCRDIAVSSMVSGHKNFMKLVGCCLEFEDPVLVYHGVNKHYKLDISELSWKRRMKVSEDIATALAYLHTAFPRPFVYRSLDRENILLDEDGVAKLSDFSYCVSIPKGETFVMVNNIVGTYGYVDRKYFTEGVVSEETDVFAIGSLMLTLLIGNESLYEFFKGEGDGDDGSDNNEFMDKIADPKMLEKMGEISEEELSQMKAFIMLSHRCISQVEVPTMVEVAKELKKIQISLQFDSPQEISSSVLIGLVGEVAKKLKKRFYLKDSPSPSPSDEEFDSPR